MLQQFGFEHVLLAAEGLSCPSALLLAAWYPHRVGSLVLVDAAPPAETSAPPAREAPPDESLLARSLRECPPAWDVLRQSLRCPLVELAGDSPLLAAEIERLLTSGLP